VGTFSCVAGFADCSIGSGNKFNFAVDDDESHNIIIDTLLSGENTPADMLHKSKHNVFLSSLTLKDARVLEVIVLRCFPIADMTYYA